MSFILLSASLYIFTDPGDARELEKMQLLTEEEYADMREKYEDDFKAGMGAETIRELLKDLDLTKMAKQIKEEIADISMWKEIKVA